MQHHADFHCHPQFKSILTSHIEEGRITSWDKLDIKIDLNILDSQTSLRQMETGNLHLAVIGLYGLEQAFAKSQAIKEAYKLSPKIGDAYFTRIENGVSSYNELMEQEVAHIKRFPVDPENGSFRVKILNSMNEYDDTPGVINLVLSVEGGHNFYNKINECDENTILTNLNKYKKPGGLRLHHITLAHITQNVLANQAFGMKLLKGDEFIPTGNGLTELGKKFIRTCYDNTNNQHRIFIDVKHMGLLSRLQFYQMRRTEGFESIPIIASHAGINGLSSSKLPARRINNRKCKILWNVIEGDNDVKFNPSSINLYDEDIVEILKSKGMIGISLDQRILGFGKISKEQFSAAEFDEIKNRTDVKHLSFWSWFTNWSDDFGDSKMFWSKSRLAENHMEYLCNNILHVVKVGVANGYADSVQNSICIGSDNDGFIDTVDCCYNASEYSQLCETMKKTMAEMVLKNGSPVSNTDLLVEKIMFYNLFNFLNKHFI